MIIKHLDLWKGYDYVGNQKPKLTLYMRNNRVRDLVLILPGGGYEFTSEREAEPVAMQFLAKGYHAAVLDYSVAPSKFPQALQDAFRALTIILENMNKWEIGNIYLCGFSAGGHLAACVSNLYKTRTFSHYPGVDIKNLRIKGTILAYPVITSGEHAHKASFNQLFGDVSHEVSKLLSMELSINDDTPQTFLWHTFDDASVPVENSLLYAKALKEKNIPFEMHIYPSGVHGLSLANEDTATSDIEVNAHVASWMDLCLKWMKTLK